MSLCNGCCVPERLKRGMSMRLYEINDAAEYALYLVRPQDLPFYPLGAQRPAYFSSPYSLALSLPRSFLFARGKIENFRSPFPQFSLVLASTDIVFSRSQGDCSKSIQVYLRRARSSSPYYLSSIEIRRNPARHSLLFFFLSFCLFFFSFSVIHIARKCLKGMRLARQSSGTLSLNQLIILNSLLVLMRSEFQLEVSALSLTSGQ